MKESGSRAPTGNAKPAIRGARDVGDNCGRALASFFRGHSFAPVWVNPGPALATVGFRMFDGLTVRMARKREDLEDLVAEARARGATEKPAQPS